MKIELILFRQNKQCKRKTCCGERRELPIQGEGIQLSEWRGACTKAASSLTTKFVEDMMVACCLNKLILF